MKLNKQFFYSLFIAVLSFVTICMANGAFKSDSLANTLRFTCDAAFAVGVIFTGIGLIIFSSDSGTFDGFSFSVHKLLTLGRRNEKDILEGYGSYKERKHQKKAEYGHYLVVGGAFLVIAVILVIGFNKVY